MSARKAILLLTLYGFIVITLATFARKVITHEMNGWVEYLLVSLVFILAMVLVLRRWRRE